MPSDIEQAKQEIEMGVSAVHKAVGGPIAPFFRFPDLQQPPELLTYLGTRNIATFSTDHDSFDFKMRQPEQVIKSVMTKLEKRGKGIVLMHDFQHATAEAMPELLRQLKAAGFKIVHMVPKAPVTTLAKYDDMLRQQDKMRCHQHASAEQRREDHQRQLSRFRREHSTHEALRAVWRRIAERRRAGHHLGDQPAGRRPERQAPMAMAVGEP